MKAESPAQEADKIDVAYVAKLARIKLTAEELSTFQAQLTQIVDYVNELKKVDVSTAGPGGDCSINNPENVLRPDVARPGLPREAVLANAPVHDHEQFLVPKII